MGHEFCWVPLSHCLSLSASLSLSLSFYTNRLACQWLEKKINKGVTFQLSAFGQVTNCRTELKQGKQADIAKEIDRERERERGAR